MKTTSVLSLRYLCTLWALISVAVAAERASESGYVVVELGQHHRVWSRVVSYTNEVGQVLWRTNSFTELSTGLHRSVNGRWVESTPQLVITNNEVIGRGAGHDLRLAGNLNSRGAVQVRLPDGQWLKSHILGLAYHDTASGSNVLIAELKDSTAQVTSNQTQVVFADAFTDFKADVTYDYRKSGVAQLVTLRERPPAPEEYGLSSTSTHLLILSEFIEAPTPQVKELFWRSGNDTLRDDTLDFGPMRMGRGRAFTEGQGRSQFNLPISKQWELLSGRRVLVERVSYAQTKEELLGLPPGSSGITNAAVLKPSRWFAEGELPASKMYSAVESRPVQQMAALKGRHGFVLDWELVYDDWWWDFWCGNTYLIDGEVHIAEAAFEPGSVIKYVANASSSLWVDQFTYFYGGECNGTTYTILTSVNDDEHGEWVEYSTGTPAVGDYGPALVVQPSELASCQANIIDLYGDPGIIANPPSLSTVTVSASDPTATKGDDSAAFTITRVNGDWNQALTVQFTVGGTAVAGADYQSLGTSATIPANQPSVVVNVNPLSGGGGLCDSTVSLTIQPNAAYQVGSPASATVAIYDPSVSPQPVATPSGLVAWWQAEGNAVDTVSGAVATLWNGASIIQGKIGQTFRFDGVNDHVRIADRPELRLTGAMTIEYWVFPTVRGTWYNNMVTKWDAFGMQNQRSYGVGCYPDGRVYFVITSTGTDAGSHSALSPAAIPLNQWTHVAGTYDGATIRLYFNGVLQAQAAHTTGVFPGSGDLAIGGAVGGAAPGQMVSPFPGWIDEVSIYNRGLSLAEIQTIYNAGCGGKFLDTDGDGLPDEWEQQHFGNLSESGTGDYDGDTWTNLQEFQNGTDPTVYDSPNGLTPGNGLQVFTPLQ